MSSLRKIGQLCLSNMKQTSRFGSSLMPISRNVQILSNTSFKKYVTPQIISTRNMSSNSDGEIAEFLMEEIQAEKSNQRRLTDIKGFEVKQEGAELTLTKKFGNEKVIVSLNVNHTVDSSEPDDGSQEAPEMKSMPNFEVDIVKSNGKTLSFSCQYIEENPDENNPEAGEEKFDDLFLIEEVTMFEGENWSDKKYAVAGDILDGYLYDLFMNMLNERGIDKNFALQLSTYCSAYEHSLYINMLEDLQKFVEMK